MPSDVDEHGIPLGGSALQIASSVNCKPESLNAAVLGGQSSASIEWRSPLAARHFAEYKDWPRRRLARRSSATEGTVRPRG
ncbi:MAG: hypothetical protein ACXVHJ_18150 [Solirubrobacteraceae bacterium]